MAPATLEERVAWLESQALAYQHIIASLAAVLHRAGIADGNAFAAGLEDYAAATAGSGQVAAGIIFERQAKMIREQLAAGGKLRPEFTVIDGGRDQTPKAPKERP